MGGDAVCVRLSEAGADPERIDRLTGFLREELLGLDVGDVRRLPAAPPPASARAVGVTAVGGLLVTLGKSAEGLSTLVAAIRMWLSRGGPGVRRTIRMELAGDVLELSEASEVQQDRLIGLFVEKHTKAG